MLFLCRVDPLAFVDNLNVSESLYFLQTDVLEIKETISSIKNSNAAGWDGIPENLISVLADVINASFSSGIFSDCQKTATVITLYKGTHKSPSNFRPILCYQQNNIKTSRKTSKENNAEFSY